MSADEPQQTHQKEKGHHGEEREQPNSKWHHNFARMSHAFVGSKTSQECRDRVLGHVGQRHKNPQLQPPASGLLTKATSETRHDDDEGYHRKDQVMHPRDRASKYAGANHQSVLQFEVLCVPARDEAACNECCR